MRTICAFLLSLSLVPLPFPDEWDACRAFDQFTYDLTTGNGSAFTLIGNTSAVTDTPLGTLHLATMSSLDSIADARFLT